MVNKLAFGQTRFAGAADPIEYISEENFLLQIFAKMDILYDLTSPNYFVTIISLGGSTTTDAIEPISEEKSLLKNNCKDMFLFLFVLTGATGCVRRPPCRRRPTVNNMTKKIF